MTWDEGGLTSEGRSCPLWELRISTHGSFERLLGTGKPLKTGSKPVSEDPIWAKKRFQCGICILVRKSGLGKTLYL